MVAESSSRPICGIRLSLHFDTGIFSAPTIDHYAAKSAGPFETKGALSKECIRRSICF